MVSDAVEMRRSRDREAEHVTGCLSLVYFESTEKSDCNSEYY